jgi:ATP-dependent Lon protease
MTGEITLSGLVLPVGGIREKSLAARRHAIKTFVLPQANSFDIAELPEEVRRDMTFVPATTIEDVLRVALPDALPGLTVVGGATSAAAGPTATTAVAATDQHR